MKENALLRFYAKYRRHLPGLALILGLTLLSGVLKMLSASYWGKAVDFGLAGEHRQMLWAAVMMAVVLLLDCTRTAAHYHLLGKITGRMFSQVRQDAFAKLLKIDLGTLGSTAKTGDTAARLSDDVNILNQFTGGQLSDFSRRVFQAVCSLIACIFISWQLALGYLLILPLSLWVLNRISKPIQARVKKSRSHVGDAMNVVSESAAGSMTIKAFAAEEQMCEKFSQRIDRAYRQEVESQRAIRNMTGVKYAGSVVQTLSLFLIGAALVEHGLLSVGAFLTFVALSAYITDCFTEMDYILSGVRRCAASAERFFEVLDLPDERTGTLTEPKSDTPCVASGVRFTYPGASVPALRDLSLTIPQGKKVAIVGESGCGKSTVMRLLCRFYTPESGELSLFGAEAAEWSTDALREHISIVTQEPQLFYGTIFENIAYGKPDCTRSEVEAALKAAELWEFVCSKEEGMDYPIGENGNRLSGGQRQRLCIARAMVKNAELVLLDEATSALDADTEREVQRSLDRLLEGKSAVIVAHRLSTVQNADYIYCMAQGGVTEHGTPAELLKQRGIYYEMCRRQGLVGKSKEGKS